MSEIKASEKASKLVFDVSEKSIHRGFWAAGIGEITRMNDAIQKLFDYIVSLEAQLAYRDALIGSLRVRAEEAEAKVADLEESNYELSYAHARAKHAEEKGRRADALIEKLIETGEQSMDFLDGVCEDTGKELPEYWYDWQDITAEWRSGDRGEK